MGGTPSTNRSGPTVVAFAAPSGTGKSTLVAALVTRLTAEGVAVGVVKHHGHPMELDSPGKDTWTLREAGAVAAVFASENQVAWMSHDQTPPSLADLIEVFFSHLDLVLVEGYRQAGMPTIVLHRDATDDPAWQPPARANILATIHPDQIDAALSIVKDQIRGRADREDPSDEGLPEEPTTER